MRKNPSTHVRVWEFRVQPRCRKTFERIYGPKGDWAQLFKNGKGYLGTELFRDAETPGRYLTVDYWKSKSNYETFRREFDREFRILDKNCESLTTRETSVGSFSSASSAGFKE
ncbi:MAG TPA: antibiotic biosynthesis monooxygenase [Terriglobia bacterium]|nr:antibiotic biosynthesis monooxygenase [Terriglobia bacterium]